MIKSPLSPPHLLIGSLLVTLLVNIPAAAQNGPTGNWTGTYTLSFQVSACQNRTFTSSGNAAVTLLQSGASLSGRIDLTNILVFNGDCNPVQQELTRVIVGTVSGSSVAWKFPNDSNGTQFNGTIDGSSLTA